MSNRKSTDDSNNNLKQQKLDLERLSLQHMLLVAIAVKLWKNEDIQQKI
ncbi:hypothetical protein [Candidatus Rickettsia colombianensi]|nr:hypothetical protein [Candidatus Rickettsia colombianensi]